MSVSLTKGKAVSLQKKNNTFGNIAINLKWNQGPKEKGLFGSIFGKKKNIDLDLACLYELKDGKKGCVQALGNLFGSLTSAPYIKLLGDDRSGTNAEGETLLINGHEWSKIKRIVVFTYIYEGVSAWSETDGFVNFTSDVNDLQITLDNGDDNHNTCVIAMIENINDEMKVTKINDYVSGHQEIDKIYNWGLNWVHGSKD